MDYNDVVLRQLVRLTNELILLRAENRRLSRKVEQFMGSVHIGMLTIILLVIALWLVKML